MFFKKPIINISFFSLLTFISFLYFEIKIKARYNRQDIDTHKLQFSYGCSLFRIILQMQVRHNAFADHSCKVN